MKNKSKSTKMKVKQVHLHADLFFLQAPKGVNMYIVREIVGNIANRSLIIFIEGGIVCKADRVDEVIEAYQEALDDLKEDNIKLMNKYSVVTKSTEHNIFELIEVQKVKAKNPEEAYRVAVQNIIDQIITDSGDLDESDKQKVIDSVELICVLEGHCKCVLNGSCG